MGERRGFRSMWGAPDMAVNCWEEVDTRRMLGSLMRLYDGIVFRCAIDVDWTILLIGGNCRGLTGYDPSELLGSRLVSYNEITLADDREAVDATLLSASAGENPYRVVYRIVCKDGTEKWVLERGVSVVDEHGAKVLEGTIEDISEQVNSRQALASAEARYRSIFEHSTEGIFQTTREGGYLSANPALARIYGYASPEAMIRELEDIGNQLYVDVGLREVFKQIMDKAGSVQGFEARVRRRDGTEIWIAENARSVYDADGNFLYYEGMVQDITEQKRYQEQLEYQANHDLLTGLPNRSLLNDRLEQAIAWADRNSYYAVVAFIDLDNFKYINDSLGHVAGDALLVEISKRLQNCLRATDTVARYGGDEFVLVLNNHYQMASLLRILDRVLEDIQRPVEVMGKELFVTSSIGLSLYPTDGGDAESLIKHADAAMYLAKERGKNKFQFFTQRLNAMATERVTLDGSLRRALDRNELVIHYQPKVDQNLRPLGMEALLRWNSAEHGWVPPDKFIGIAEETGLIEPLTEFVLREACHQAMIWSRAGYGDLRMAVNLSARSLQQKNLVELITQVLEESGLPPDRLELEITESMVIGNIEQSIAVLQAIKNLGVRLAIDDFGTGYSSLSYLQRLPVHLLKIDRSFVRNLGVEANDSHIAHLIVLLGHGLGLSVVAEGVETTSQREYLVALGCDEYQGFLFSRPMGVAELEASYLRVAWDDKQADT